MPFWYHLSIPPLGDPLPATVRIDKWLLDEGSEVHRGTKIAIIEASKARFAVTTNGDGFLREKLFPAGAEVDASNPIAVIAADGEDIPYNRPYALVEPA